VACAEQDVKVPKHLDIFFLKKEIDPTEMTALQAVLDVDVERKRLEAEVRACKQLWRLYKATIGGKCTLCPDAVLPHPRPSGSLRTKWPTAIA